MSDIASSSKNFAADETRPLISEKIQQKRLVAFLDIMGFKDMVARHFNEIERQLTSLSKFISQIISEHQGYQYMIFSDSIIIYASAEIEDVFHNFLSKVARIIEKSIELGLPIKGAIAFGDCSVCMDDKPFVFGQPIIDAYVLEENVVLYGVVLHNSVEEFAMSECINSQLVFDYRVPLKGGCSSHYILNWFGNNQDGNESNLLAIRKTVSDSPRRYIDNTKACMDFLKNKI